MRIIVTGCAGFIGSALVDRLLASGACVIGIDNFSTGQRSFLDGARSSKDFHFYEADLLDMDEVKRIFSGGDLVYHLAANADVRFGPDHPRRDLEQNTLVTFNVLEAMRFNHIKKIAFTSTGSIYGEPRIIPTPENAPFPIQTSFYGASKLACEGLIAAYCESYGFQSWIFRLVSVLGERYTHGHIFDFYRSLRRTPDRLRILGDGEQRKSYVYVQDCLDAIILAVARGKEKVNILNIGNDETFTVKDSVRTLCSKLGLSPELECSGGDRGWVGDVPHIHLDTEKIRSLGWSPKMGIQESVVRTLEYLMNNEWLLESR